MYTNNNDVASFNLNDDDYEEEEIIERDEYYDGDDADYYDDGDEDEYNEEDEHYDDGEYYDNEHYDDGHYDEEYYNEGDYNYPAEAASASDDVLNRILDEIAALKRSVAYPQVMPMPVAAPPMAYGFGGLPFVYSPFPTQTIVQPNNEVAIYNELARVREDLTKTQSSQLMYVEVSRLKDNMRLDAKINETKLQNEIYRLNQQISNMQNNQNRR